MKGLMTFIQGEDLTSEFPFFICKGNDAIQFHEVSRFNITTHRGILIDVISGDFIKGHGEELL